MERMDPRGVRLWGPGYLRSLFGERPDPGTTVHLYVCVADHFEPRWRKPTLDDERRRVDAWVTRYPAIAKAHRDTDGNAHVRTLFYPEEEYRREHLDAIKTLVDAGYADVEVHLHHDHDTADNLRGTLLDFTRTLYDDHGLLRRDPVTGWVTYAFIHGNWALDNAHPAGIFCGVDNELSVLVETGCYVDMTMPAVPSPAQSRTVNQIAYVRGRPGAARGHDRGRPVCVGGARKDNELMLLPGPLGVHIRSRAMGLVPRIEAAMLEPENPVPIPLRVRSWVANAPAVLGAPNHRFIKLHAHGCNGTGPDYFLDPSGPFARVLHELESVYADGRRYALHYVTARQLYDIVRHIEAGGIPNRAKPPAQGGPFG